MEQANELSLNRLMSLMDKESKITDRPSKGNKKKKN